MRSLISLKFCLLSPFLPLSFSPFPFPIPSSLSPFPCLAPRCPPPLPAWPPRHLLPAGDPDLQQEHASFGGKKEEVAPDAS